MEQIIQENIQMLNTSFTQCLIIALTILESNNERKTTLWNRKHALYKELTSKRNKLNGNSKVFLDLKTVKMCDNWRKDAKKTYANRNRFITKSVSPYSHLKAVITCRNMLVTCMSQRVIGSFQQRLWLQHENTFYPRLQ